MAAPVHPPRGTAKRAVKVTQPCRVMLDRLRPVSTLLSVPLFPALLENTFYFFGNAFHSLAETGAGSCGTPTEGGQ